MGTPEQLFPIGKREKPTSDREAREAPQRGDLHYLWHPGTEDVFSGYGLVMEDGKRNRLVGLLLVDRPALVDPAWLASVKATFGEYELHPMTTTGARGILCEMRIGQEDEPFLRQFAGETSSAIQHALLPLLDQPPLPSFRLSWDAEARAWQSRFHLELPDEIRAVFAKLGDQQEEDDPEVHVRQLPNSGWPECFDSEADEYAHLCNAVHVFEGINEEGQLYVRREWGIGGRPPDDFIPHNWGPAYVPESSDTLETVLADLDRMVEKGSLSPDERARSEAFYRRLFSE